MSLPLLGVTLKGYGQLRYSILLGGVYILMD